MDTIYNNSHIDGDSQQFDAISGSMGRILDAAQTERLNENIQVTTLDLYLNESQVIEAIGPPTFCIAIFLDGYAQLSIDSGPVLAVEPGMMVVFHAPDSVGGRNVFHGNSRLHCLDLRYSPQYLCSIGLGSLNMLPPMFEHNCSVADVMMLARPTSVRLLAIARVILTCTMSGLARRVFLQAKALEALSHVLTILEQPGISQPRLSKMDQHKVRQAMQLLDRSYQMPWTIRRLSREVGLNERKLKAGFHRLAQSTVHKYLEDARLCAARALLSAGEKVTDVAIAVGYASPSHFAKRFKRRFDVAPSQWC